MQWGQQHGCIGAPRMRGLRQACLQDHSACYRAVLPPIYMEGFFPSDVLLWKMQEQALD